MNKVASLENNYQVILCSVWVLSFKRLDQFYEFLCSSSWHYFYQPIKTVAVPIVLSSLVTGVASLPNTKKRPNWSKLSVMLAQQL